MYYKYWFIFLCVYFVLSLLCKFPKKISNNACNKGQQIKIVIYLYTLFLRKKPNHSRVLFKEIIAEKSIFKKLIINPYFYYVDDIRVYLWFLFLSLPLVWWNFYSADDEVRIGPIFYDLSFVFLLSTWQLILLFLAMSQILR